MTWSIVLGLGSGLFWGAADFMGGLQSRRLSAITVALWSQAVGGAVLLAVLLLTGPVQTTGAIWGMGAGLCGATALLLFYHALAVGTMSVVAPISACGAVIPVIAGLLQGERFELLTVVGILVAMLGVILVSTQSGPPQSGQGSRSALAFAVGAAFGFGMFFTLLDRGTSLPGASPLWVNVWGRAGSLPLVAILQLVTARSLGWPGSRLPAIGLVGVLDMGANVLFATAAQLGALGIVAVLSSLYPVTTVLLSWFILAERLSRMQYVGVALALLGIALLAAG